MLEPTNLLQQMSKYSTKQPLKVRHANPGGGGGGGNPTKVHTGKLSPEGQHLTLLYTICDRRGTPFVYQPYDKK